MGAGKYTRIQPEDAINSALRRLLVPLLRSIHAGKPISFRMKSAAQQALFLVQRKPSPSRKKPAQARKSAKQAAHRESTGAIREAVWARAEGRCEFCRGHATEMHHLEGGSRRRSHQAVSNCVALCMICHRAYHKDPNSFRPAVRFWADFNHYPIPRRFLRPAPAVAQPPLGHSGSEAGGKE